MILKLFTVYDSKIGAYKEPIYLRSTGEALRAMTETLSNAQHQFSKFSEDYTLFELGEYDDTNASFNLHLTPKTVCKISELKSQQPAQLQSA